MAEFVISASFLFCRNGSESSGCRAVKEDMLWGSSMLALLTSSISDHPDPLIGMHLGISWNVGLVRGLNLHGKCVRYT